MARNERQREAGPEKPESPLRLRRVSQREEWQMCLRKQAGATVFHEWDWLHLMASGLRCHFLSLGLYDVDGLVGLAPLLVKQYGPYKNANWSPFPYLGVLTERDRLPKALQLLDQYQRRNGISLIQLGFAPHAPVDVPVLQSYGYTVHMNTTMVVPLAGKDEATLLARMSSKRRSRLRRAQRAGITLRPSTDFEMSHDFNCLLAEVFGTKDMPTAYPAEIGAMIWNRFHNDPRARLMTAIYQGEVVAMAIGIHDGRTAYAWQAAGYHRFRQLNAVALLRWDTMCWAREQGCIAFDLVGNPSPSIAEYKRQFGADEVPYAVANRSNSILAVGLRSGYGRLQLQMERWRGSNLPFRQDAGTGE